MYFMLSCRACSAPSCIEICKRRPTVSCSEITRTSKSALFLTAKNIQSTRTLGRNDKLRVIHPCILFWISGKNRWSSEQEFCKDRTRSFRFPTILINFLFRHCAAAQRDVPEDRICAQRALFAFLPSFPTCSQAKF